MIAAVDWSLKVSDAGDVVVGDLAGSGRNSNGLAVTGAFETGDWVGSLSISTGAFETKPGGPLPLLSPGNTGALDTGCSLSYNTGALVTGDLAGSMLESIGASDN